MESRYLKTNRSSGKRNRLYRKPLVPNLQYAKLMSMSDLLLIQDLEQWFSAGDTGSGRRAPSCIAGALRCHPTLTGVHHGLSRTARLCVFTETRLSLILIRTELPTNKGTGRKPALSIVRNVSNYTTAPGPGVSRHPEILHTGTT